MDKREFLKKATLATVLTSFGLSLENCSSDEAPEPNDLGSDIIIDLNVNPFTALKSSNGWVLHPDRNILLVNVTGTVVAFSSECTHQGCTRNWNFDGEFICTCHSSRFNTDGDVTNGPASRPLTRIAVKRAEDILTLG